jgi:hypothetical protein
MKQLITKLLSTIADKGGRLDVITDLQIHTSSEEVNQACIDLREEIVDGTFKTEEIKINDLI